MCGYGYVTCGLPGFQILMLAPFILFLLIRQDKFDYTKMNGDPSLSLQVSEGLCKSLKTSRKNQIGKIGSAENAAWCIIVVGII